MAQKGSKYCKLTIFIKFILTFLWLETYDESDEDDDYGRCKGKIDVNKYKKGNNPPNKQQTDSKPAGKTGNKFEFNKKNVFDDDDEYDDEIAPYPLNKHNDSDEKISAKTEPKWNQKAS